MLATMTDCLPKSRESSPAYRIWRETEGGLEEKITANFIHAFKTYWKDYFPKDKPRFPQGFEMDHDAYLQLEELTKKSEAWKAIKAKYSGYFTALEECIAENLSNLWFLKQGLEHFEKIGMIDYAGKLRQLIARHEGLAA